MQPVDMNLLRKSPLFAPLSDRELDELSPAVAQITADVGAVVVREGEIAYRMFCVLEGQVQVIKNYLQDGSQTIAVLDPGDFFGEMALLGGETKRSATVVTAGPTRLAAIHSATFREILMSRPAIALAMLSEAYRRLRQANDIIATLRKEEG